MRWLSENYKWLFDGVGGAATIAFIAYLINRFLGPRTDGFGPKSSELQETLTGGTAQRKVTAPPFAPAENQPGTTPSVWPAEKGEYIANSSDTIPQFPVELSGFRPAGNNKDFWNKPFPNEGWIRLFSGNDWEGIEEFPHTMNGCSHGVFMIRWRSAHPDISIRSSVRHSSQSNANEKIGAFGYMFGTNCEQPMFKFGENRNGATLVDVYYELKFWRAAP